MSGQAAGGGPQRQRQPRLGWETRPPRTGRSPDRLRLARSHFPSAQHGAGEFSCTRFLSLLPISLLRFHHLEPQLVRNSLPPLPYLYLINAFM